MINSFFVDRIYLKGSLRNLEDGFEFSLRNRIDTGTLVGFKSLSVDGIDIPLIAITLRMMGDTWPAREVNYSNPVSFKFGQDARVQVTGSPLAPGEHTLILTASVAEVGRAQLQFTDLI